MIDKYDYSKGQPQIGSGVAESDVKQFPSGFIKLQTYQLIGLPDTVYIAGRKGSGKSALCIEYGNKEIDNYSYIFTMGKSSLEYTQFKRSRHRLLNNSVSDSDIDQLSREAWLLTLQINLMIAICTSGAFADENVREMRAYLTRGKWYDFGSKQKIAAFVAAIIDRFALVKVAGDVVSAISDHMQRDADTASAIVHLKKWLGGLRKPVLFMVDDIDEELQSPTTEPDRKHAVSFCDGLVHASYKMCYPTFSEMFHLKVFVPQDLFSQINQRHLDKTGISKIDVSWSKEQLANLLSLRLHKNLPPEKQRKWNYQTDSAKVFSYYLPEKMPIQMLGQRHPHPFPTMNVIQSYTMQRPRDLIQFVQQLFRQTFLDKHKEISTDMIWDAIQRYSSELISKIEREYSTANVDIGDIMRSFRGLGRHFTSKEMADHLNSLPQVPSPAEANRVIDVLYDSGFLGIVTAQQERAALPGRAPTVERFYYDRNELHAHGAERFAINNAFVRGLNLKAIIEVR